MKTTIKLHRKDAVIMPNPVGGVDLNLFQSRGEGGEYITGVTLTPDQCGALIFGMEQALEVVQQERTEKVIKYQVASYANGIPCSMEDAERAVA